MTHGPMADDGRWQKTVVGWAPGNIVEPLPHLLLSVHSHIQLAALQTIVNMSKCAEPSAWRRVAEIVQPLLRLALAHSAGHA